MEDYKIHKCNKCGEKFEQIDDHHPDKVNNPKLTIKLCKDCHYSEHHQEKTKYSKDILSAGYGMLPNIILFDNKISSTGKLLYVLISSLSASTGFCWASNKYLASKLNISQAQISVILSKLEKYLTFEDRTSWRRKIYLKNLMENTKEPLGKSKGHLMENLKHNIISNKDKDKDKDNNINIISENSEEFPQGTIQGGLFYEGEDIAIREKEPIKRTYGNGELNELTAYAKSKGFPLQGTQKMNRNNAYNLLRKYGLEKSKVLIDCVANTRGMQFAPTINDFVQLYRKVADLITFCGGLERKKNGNGKRGYSIG